MTRPTLHVRMPQRADAVEGGEQKSGKAGLRGPDTHTSSPELAPKPSAVQKAEDGIVAELDQGPMGA
jgi:hypothetical protein